MQKARLIAQTQTERQNLENALAKFNPEQLETPGAVGVWSVKDTLAHIAAWQHRLTVWLLEYAVEAETQSTPPYGLDDEPLDRLNYQIYIDHRDKKLSEVLSFLQSAYHQSLEAIQSAPEELLSQAKPSLSRGKLGRRFGKSWPPIHSNMIKNIITIS
jgi:hypothetical protein